MTDYFAGAGENDGSVDDGSVNNDYEDNDRECIVYCCGDFMSSGITNIN